MSIDFLLETWLFINWIGFGLSFLAYQVLSTGGVAKFITSSDEPYPENFLGDSSSAKQARIIRMTFLATIYGALGLMLLVWLPSIGAQSVDGAWLEAPSDVVKS